MADCYAHWQSGSCCGCGTQHYVAEEIVRKEVPLCNNGDRIVANTGRTILGIFTLGVSELVAGCPGDLTHEAIQMLFKCGNCNAKFYATCEVYSASVGKQWRWGKYTRQFENRASCTYKRSYAQLKATFDGMWGGGSYNLCYNNCKDWCREFWDKF